MFVCFNCHIVIIHNYVILVAFQHMHITCNDQIKEYLTKEVNDLYDENHKTPMRGLEEGTREWKGVLCSWIGKINIVKMFILGAGLVI